MRIILLVLMVTNLYAVDKNIFFDAKIDVPLVGSGTYNDGYGSSEEEYYTPRAFLGVALGYSIKLHDEWVFEPSIGYSFNTDDALSFSNSYTYNYADITLPLMYKRKAFKGGVFFKYMDINSIDMGERTVYLDNSQYEEKIQFKNKNPYTIGIKIVTRSWFYSYEYLFKGKYSTDDEKAKIDIEGSRLSVGLRVMF